MSDHTSGEPTSDELRGAFDAIVGNPSPTGDLAVRARHRGGAIRRQRLAGAVTGIVAVGILTVPAVALVRDQSPSHGTFDAGGQPTVVGTTGSPAPSAEPTFANQGGPDSLPNGLRGPDKLDPTAVPGAVDKARIAAAEAALPGFTETLSGVVVNADTGEVAGTLVMLAAPNGRGSVKIEWDKVVPTPGGGPSGSASADTSGGPSAAPSADASGATQILRLAASATVPAQASATVVVGGRTSYDGITGIGEGNGKIQVNIGLVIDAPSSPRALTGVQLKALADTLLKTIG